MIDGAVFQYHAVISDVGHLVLLRGWAREDFFFVLLQAASYIKNACWCDLESGTRGTRTRDPWRDTELQTEHSSKNRH